MIPVNFSQLYYFWVIARAGSITAARKTLLLNQSTLSMQLKQLETSLGKRLLSRSQRGVSLTEDGRTAFEYCDRIFTQADELLSVLRSGGVRPPAVLRLGYSRSIASGKALSVSRYVKTCDRGVAVRVSSGHPEELESQLRRRSVDVVLSDVDFSGSLGRDYRARLVASIPHYFVAAPALKEKVRTFPEGLAAVPLLLRSPENGIRKEVEHFMHRSGILPRVHAEVEDPDMILAMILAGEGVGVLDPLTVCRYLEHGRLVRLHERPIGIRENLWLLTGRRPHPSRTVQDVVDRLMERFRLLPPRGRG